MKIEELEKREE